MITQEKEANSWEILLTTPLTGGQIIWGKFFGVLKRWWPTSLLFFGHGLIFYLFGFIHPLYLLLLVPMLIGPIFFIIGTGIYISLKVRHTTTAVLLNLAMISFVWFGIPLLGALIGYPLGYGNDLCENLFCLNPIYWNCETIWRLSGNRFMNSTYVMEFDFQNWGRFFGNALNYRHISPFQTVLFIYISSIFHFLAGVVLICRSAAGVRKMKRGKA